MRFEVEHSERWREAFASRQESYSGAGLRLLSLWSDLDKAGQFFALFDVTDLDAARAFLEDGRTDEADELAGVLRR